MTDEQIKECRQERNYLLDRLHPRIIGKDWRLLDDDEVIERTDQAADLSELLAGYGDWHRLDEISEDHGDEWAPIIGKKVGDHVDSDDDADCWLRIFRRQLSRTHATD